jgi:hypothetical protein
MLNEIIVKLDVYPCFQSSGEPEEMHEFGLDFFLF